MLPAFWRPDGRALGSKTKTLYKEIGMRIMVLLCTIWLTGCTTTRVMHFTMGDESWSRQGMPTAFKEQPWVSVSAWVISYPADQRFISNREIKGNRRTQSFQQYPHLQFAREGYSFVTAEEASDILALADSLDSVQIVEMPRHDVLVNGSGTSMVGSLPGFGVWLRTLTVSGSSATIEYRVMKLGHPYTTPDDQEAKWEMSGEAELGLGVCYLKTIATDDPQFKVAVLLRLVSISHPNQHKNTEV